MIPAKIPEHLLKENNGLQKVVYGPPKGVSDIDCSTIETLQGTYQGGVFDGSPAIVTYWKPSEAELQYLIESIDDPTIEIVLLMPVCPVIQVNVQ